MSADLAAFLLARIEEDESRLARRPRFLRRRYDPRPDVYATKRRIVEMVRDIGPHIGMREEVLQQLALPYSSHPDYDPSWRL